MIGGISSRRVRVMLVEGHLEGRQLESGYWQVFHPYRYANIRVNPTGTEK